MADPKLLNNYPYLILYLSDNFYQQMNDQLKRIRQKDYSQIDQTLFQNMARTDNLSSTLSHLSEFQQFLMQQIKLLNHPKANQAASLTSSINRNFDTLRESLVNCSRIKSQNEATSASASARKKLAEMKEATLMVKVEIKAEINKACKEAQQIAQNALKQVLSVLEEERIARKSLQQKCKMLELERDTLIKQKEELKNHVKNQTVNTFRSHIRQETSNLNRQDSIHRSAMLAKQESDYTYSNKNVGQPLTQQKHPNSNHHAFHSIPSFSEKEWKIRREEVPVDSGPQARRHSLNRYSLSRQTSNHKLSSKQNLNLIKENQILLSKGVRDERRKSKQKIKIFSLM